MRVLRPTATLALLMATSVLLLQLRPSSIRMGARLPELLDHAPTDSHAVDQLGLLLATLGSWLALGWLGLGVTLVFASRLPGAMGRVARRTARALLPHAIRSAIAAVLSMSVIAGSTSQAWAAEGAGPHSDPSSVAVVPFDLDWPMSPSVDTTSKTPTDGRSPASVLADDVVVRRGDTLWRIAAEHLPPDATSPTIAEAWPLWWRANYSTIGDDPSYLEPGQRLKNPRSVS